MSEEVEDFLAHYGVRGMKWGKRKASYDDGSSGSGSSGEPKQRMSQKKKIAIAVGVTSTVAIGAAVAFTIINSNKNSSVNFPVHKLSTNKSMLAGKANLIFNAAAMNTPVPPAPKKDLVEKVKEKAFDTTKSAVINKAQKVTYDDFKAMRNPPPRITPADKAKGVVTDKAAEIAIKKIRDVANEKAKKIDSEKKKQKDLTDDLLGDISSMLSKSKR